MMHEDNFEKKMQRKKIKFDKNQIPKANVEGSITNVEVSLLFFLNNQNKIKENLDYITPIFLFFVEQWAP